MEAMSNVSFSPQGPPETVLPALNAELDAKLQAARDDARPRNAVAVVVADHPTLLEGWASLGEIAEQSAHDVRGHVEAYAYFRIGYHRGLDTLRKNGWKGSGFVRWDEPTNRGFLRCLSGLQRMADQLGEQDEAARCSEFLLQLDPAWGSRNS